MAPYDSDHLLHSNEESASSSCSPLPDPSAAYGTFSPPPASSLCFSHTPPPGNFAQPLSCSPKSCALSVSPSPSSFSPPSSSLRLCARSLSVATLSAAKDDSFFRAADTPARPGNKNMSGQQEKECKDTRQVNGGKTQNDHLCQRLEAQEVRVFWKAQNSPDLPHLNPQRKYVYAKRKCSLVLHCSSHDTGSLAGLEEQKNNCTPGAPPPVPYEAAAFSSASADETTCCHPRLHSSTSNEPAPVSWATAASLLPEATATVERSVPLHFNVTIPGAASARDAATLGTLASVPFRAAAAVLTGAGFSSTSAVVHSADIGFAADADNTPVPSDCGTVVPSLLPFFRQEGNTSAVLPATSTEARLSATAGSFACRCGYVDAHPGGFAYCRREEQQLQRNRFIEEREEKAPQDAPVETSVHLYPCVSLRRTSLHLHRHRHLMRHRTTGPEENQQHQYRVVQQLPQCTWQVQPLRELQPSRQLEPPDQQWPEMLLQLQQQPNHELLVRSMPELLPHLQTQIPLQQPRRHTVHLLTMHLCELGTHMHMRQNRDQVSAECSIPQLQAGKSVEKRLQHKHGEGSFEEECHGRGVRQWTTADQQQQPYKQEWQCQLQERQQKQDQRGSRDRGQQLKHHQQLEEEESTLSKRHGMEGVRSNIKRLLSDRPADANVGSGGTVAWLLSKADPPRAAVVQAEDTAGTARGFTAPGERGIVPVGQVEATRHVTVAWATEEKPAAPEAIGALTPAIASATRITASAGGQSSSAEVERLRRRTTAEGKDLEEAYVAPTEMCPTPVRVECPTAALSLCLDPVFVSSVGREEAEGCRLTAERGRASPAGAPWIVEAAGRALAAETVSPWAPAAGSRSSAAAETHPAARTSAATLKRAAPSERCTAERLQSALDEPEERPSLYAWRHEGGMKGVTRIDKEAAAYAVEAHVGSEVLERPAEALRPAQVTVAATPAARLATASSKGFAAGSAAEPATGLRPKAAVAAITACAPHERRGCGFSTGQTVDLTDEVALEYISLEYSYDELYAATAGFSVLLGQGASGSVYKGVLRDGGSVAVKWLRKAKGAGFEREVRVLSKFRHPNLVILLGFGRHKSDRFLVYELLAGGDVGARLQKGPVLGWSERLSVALDTACALSHLQHRVPQVYHRDIKTANILLDRHNCAKVADFGLACLAKKGERGCTVQQAAGTVGYADPRYITSWLYKCYHRRPCRFLYEFSYSLKLPSNVLFLQTSVSFSRFHSIVTERTEVYSFGMVLLELLTAKPPAILNPDGSITYLLSVIGSSVKRTVRYVDPRANFPPVVAEALAHLAFECVQENQERRPSFQDLVHSLRQLCRSAEEGVPSPLKVEARCAEPSAAAALACAPLELLPDQSLLPSQSSRLQSRECRRRSWAFTAGSLGHEDSEVDPRQARPVPVAMSACCTGSSHCSPRDVVQPAESAVFISGCVSPAPAGAVPASVAPGSSGAADARLSVTARGADSAAAAAATKCRGIDPSAAWVRPAAPQKTGADAGEGMKEIDIGNAVVGTDVAHVEAVPAVSAAAALGCAASEPAATGAAVLMLEEGSEAPSRGEEAEAASSSSATCGQQHRRAAKVAGLAEAAARAAETTEVLLEVFQARSQASVDLLRLPSSAAAHKRQVEDLSPNKRPAGAQPRLRGVEDHAVISSRSERRGTVPTAAADKGDLVAAADKKGSTAPADREGAPAAALQVEEVKPERDGRVKSEAAANHTVTATEEFRRAAAHAEPPAAEERGAGDDEMQNTLTPMETGISATDNTRADDSVQSDASNPLGNFGGGARQCAAAEDDEEGVMGRWDKPLRTTASKEGTHKKTRRSTEKRSASRGEHSSRQGCWRVLEVRGNPADTLKQLQRARNTRQQEQTVAEAAAQESQQEREQERNKQQEENQEDVRDEGDGQPEEMNKEKGRQMTTGRGPRSDSSSGQRLLQLLQAQWRSNSSNRRDRGQPRSSSSSSEGTRREDSNGGTDSSAQDEQHDSTSSSLRGGQSRRNSSSTIHWQPMQQPNRRRMGRRTARSNSIHNESGISDSGSADGVQDRGSRGSNSNDESSSDSRVAQPRHRRTNKAVQRRGTSVRQEVQQQLPVTTTSTGGLHAASQTGALGSFAAAAALAPAAARVLAGQTAAGKHLKGLLRELQHKQKVNEEVEQQQANDQQQTHQQAQQTSPREKRRKQYALVLQPNEEQLQQKEGHQEPQRLQTQQERQRRSRHHEEQNQHPGQRKQEEQQHQRHQRQEEQQHHLQKEHLRERHPAKKLEKQKQNHEKPLQEGQQLEPQQPQREEGQGQQQKELQQRQSPEEEQLQPRQPQQEEGHGSPPPREEVRQRQRLTQHHSGRRLDAEGLLMLRRTLGEYVDFEELSEKLLLLWESLRNKKRALDGLRLSLQSWPSQDNMREGAIAPEASLSPKDQQNPATARSIADNNKLLNDSPQQPLTASYSLSGGVITMSPAAATARQISAAAVPRRPSDEAEEAAFLLKMARGEAAKAGTMLVGMIRIANMRVGVSTGRRATGARRTAPPITSAISNAVVRRARATTIDASPLDGTQPRRLRSTLLQLCAQQQGLQHPRQSGLQQQEEQDKRPVQRHLSPQRGWQSGSEQPQQLEKAEEMMQQDESTCSRKARKEVSGDPAASLKETTRQQRVPQKHADDKKEDAVPVAADPPIDTQQKERVTDLSRRSLNTQELLTDEVTELDVIAHSNDFSPEVVIKRSRLQKRRLRQQQEERERRRQQRQEQRERHHQRRQLRQLLWLQDLQGQRTLKRQHHQKGQQEKQQRADAEEAKPEVNANETYEGDHGKNGRRLRLSTRQKLQWKGLLLQMTAEERRQMYNEAHRLILDSDKRRAAEEAKRKEQKQAKQQNVYNRSMNDSKGKWLPPTEAALAALGDSVPLIQQQKSLSSNTSGSALLLASGGEVSACSSSIPDSTSSGEQLEVLLLHAVEAVDPGGDEDINAATQTRAQRRKAAAARKNRSSTTEKREHKGKEGSENEERGPDALWKLWYDRSHQQQGQQQRQWDRRRLLQERREESQPFINCRQACRGPQQQQRQECRQQQTHKQQQQMHKQQQQRQLPQAEDARNSACRLSRYSQSGIVAVGEQQQQQQRALQQLQQQQQTVQMMQKTHQFQLQQELLQQLHQKTLHWHQQHARRSHFNGNPAPQKPQVEVSAASRLLGALMDSCAADGTSLQRQLLLRCGARQTLMQQEWQPGDNQLAAGAADLKGRKYIHRALPTEEGTALQTLQQQQHRLLGVPYRCDVLPELVDQRTRAFFAAPTPHRQQGNEALSFAVNIEGQVEQQRQQQGLLAAGISTQQVQHVQQHPERWQARRTAATMRRGEPAARVADMCLVGAARAESGDIYDNRVTMAPPRELSSAARAAAGRHDSESAAAECRHGHSAAVAFGSTSRCGTTAAPKYETAVAGVSRDYSATAADRDVEALAAGRNYRFPAATGRRVENVQPTKEATIHQSAAAAASSRCRCLGAAPTHEKTELGAATAAQYDNAAAIARGEGDTAVSARRPDGPGAAARYAREIRTTVRDAAAVAHCAHPSRTAEVAAGKCEEAAAERVTAAAPTLKVRTALLAECLAAYQSGRCPEGDASGSRQLDATATALQCDTTAASPAKSNSKRATASCCEKSTVVNPPYRHTGAAAEAPRPTAGSSAPLKHQTAATSVHAQPLKREPPTCWRETFRQQYQLQQRQPLASSSRTAGQQIDLQQEVSRRDTVQQLLREHWQVQANQVPDKPLEPQLQEPHAPHSNCQQPIQQDCWTEQVQQQQQQPQRKLVDVQQQLLREWVKLMGGGVHMTDQQIKALVKYAPVLARHQSHQEIQQQVQRQTQQLNADRAGSTWSGAIAGQQISPHGFHTVPAGAAAVQTHCQRGNPLAHRKEYSMQSMFLEQQQQQETGGVTRQELDFLLTSPLCNKSPSTTKAAATAADVQLDAWRAALRDATPCCSPVTDSNCTGVSKRGYSSKCRDRGRRRKKSRRSKSQRKAKADFRLNSRNRRCRYNSRIGSMVCTNRRRSKKTPQPSKSNNRNPEHVADRSFTKSGNKPRRSCSRRSRSGTTKNIQVSFGCDNVAAAVSAAARRARRNSSSRTNCQENISTVKEGEHRTLKQKELSECAALKQMPLAAPGIRENVIAAATARGGGSSVKNAGLVTAACGARASLMGEVATEATAEGQVGMESARRSLATEVNVSTGDCLTLGDETWKSKATKRAVAGAGHQRGGVKAAAMREKFHRVAPIEAAKNSTGSWRVGSLLCLQQGSVRRSSSKDSSNRSPSGGNRRSNSKKIECVCPRGKNKHIQSQALPLQEHYDIKSPCCSSALHACAAVCNAFHIAPAASTEEAAAAAATATVKKALATAASASKPATRTTGANEHSAAGPAKRGADVSAEGGKPATAAAAVRLGSPETAVAVQNAVKRLAEIGAAEVKGYIAAGREHATGAVTCAPGGVKFSAAAPALTWPATAERKEAIRLVRRQSLTPSTPQRLWVDRVEQRALGAGSRRCSFPRHLQQFSRNSRSSSANSDNDSCRGRDSCGGNAWQQQRRRANESTIRTPHKYAPAAVTAAYLSSAIESVCNSSIRPGEPYVVAALPINRASSVLLHAHASGTSLGDFGKKPPTRALSVAKASTVSASLTAPLCHSVNAAAGAASESSAVTGAAAARISKWGPSGAARESENADGSVLSSQLPGGRAAKGAAVAATARGYGKHYTDCCRSDVVADRIVPLSQANIAGKAVLLRSSPSAAAAILAMNSSAGLAAPGTQAAPAVSAAPAAYQRLHANAERWEPCFERGERREVATHDNMHGDTREALLQQLQPHFQPPLQRHIEGQERANPSLQLEQQFWNPKTERQEMSRANCTEMIRMLLTSQQMQRQTAQQHLQLLGGNSERPQQVCSPLETWRQQQCELWNCLQQQQVEMKHQRKVKSAESHTPQGRLQQQTLHGNHVQQNLQQQQDQQQLSPRQQQQLKLLCTLLTRHQQQKSQKTETIATQILTSTEGQGTLKEDQHQQMLQPDTQQHGQPLCAGKQLLRGSYQWQQLRTLLLTWQHMQQQQRCGRSGLQQAFPQPQQQALIQQQQPLIKQQQALTPQQQALTQQQQQAKTQHPGAQFYRVPELQKQQLSAAAGIPQQEKELDVNLLPHLQHLEMLQQHDGQLKWDGASQSCTQKGTQSPPLFHIYETRSLSPRKQQQARPRQGRMARTGVQDVQDVLLRSHEQSLVPQMRQRLPCAVLPDHQLQQQLLCLKSLQHAPRQQQLLLATTEQPRTQQQQILQQQLQQPLHSRSVTLQQLRAAACLLQQASAQQHPSQEYWLEQQRQRQQAEMQQHQQVKLSLQSQQQQQHYTREGHKCFRFVSSRIYDQLHKLHQLEHLRRLQQQQTNAASRTGQEYLPFIREQREQPHFLQQHHAACHAANRAVSAVQRTSNQQGRKVSSLQQHQRP